MNSDDLLEHQRRQQEYGAERIRLGETRVGRRVVCAANRQGELIAMGVRHGCPLMMINANAIGMSLIGSEQGFVDQYGIFLTRPEALVIARKAGQVLDEGCVRGDWLHSEDLY